MVVMMAIPKEPAQLPHHVIQTRTLSHLRPAQLCNSQGRQRHEQDGHPNPTH